MVADLFAELYDKYDSVAWAREEKERAYHERDTLLERIQSFAPPELVEAYSKAVADVTAANKEVKNSETALKESISEFINVRLNGDWENVSVPYGKLVKHVQFEIIDLRKAINWLFAIGAETLIEIQWDNAKVRGMLEALLGDSPSKVLPSEDDPAASITRGFKVTLSSDWKDYEPSAETPDSSAANVDTADSSEG